MGSWDKPSSGNRDGADNPNRRSGSPYGESSKAPVSWTHIWEQSHLDDEYGEADQPEDTESGDAGSDNPEPRDKSPQDDRRDRSGEAGSAVEKTSAIEKIDWNPRLNDRLQTFNDHLQSWNDLLERRNDRLEARNDRLEARNEQLDESNDKLRADNARLSADNAKLRAENGRLRAENDQLGADLAKKQARLDAIGEDDRTDKTPGADTAKPKPEPPTDEPGQGVSGEGESGEDAADVPPAVDRPDPTRPAHPDIVARYPADYKPPPSDAPLPQVDGPHVSPKPWLGATNPRDPNRFDGSRAYNCGECARAVDGTWHGYPKVAAAIDYPRLGGEDKDRMEEWAGTECTDASMADIKLELDRLGPGSSAVVGVMWKGSTRGHWFNAVNDAGTVAAVDGQNGEVEVWPPSDEGLGFSEAGMRESFVIYVGADGRIIK